MSKETNLEDVVKELKAVQTLLIFVNSDKLRSELLRYASTADRRIIWTLIDGKRKTEDIIKQTGIAKRTVYEFLEFLDEADLIERKHGAAPVRLIGYVPPDWLSEQDKKSKKVKKISDEA